MKFRDMTLFRIFKKIFVGVMTVWFESSISTMSQRTKLMLKLCKNTTENSMWNIMNKENFTNVCEGKIELV